MLYACRSAVPEDSRHATQDESIQGHINVCCVPAGLLCLKTAKSGGKSELASSITIYNELLKRDPQLIQTLVSMLLLLLPEIMTMHCTYTCVLGNSSKLANCQAGHPVEVHRVYSLCHVWLQCRWLRL